MGKKTKVLAINPSIELHERIETLIERGGGHLSKRGLSLLALEHGLDLYERAINNVEEMFGDLTPSDAAPKKEGCRDEGV